MRVECILNIEAPLEFVYQVSQDYAVRYEWDPFPEKISLMNGANKIEKGVCVAVKAKSGFYMEVEFVQVKPPTTTAIKMHKGPIFLKAFSGNWIFKSEHPSCTYAKFVYSIEMKSWAFPYLSERFAKWYFSRAIEARLSGLKAYCESQYKI